MDLFTTVEQVALKTASQWTVYHHLALRHLSKRNYDQALLNLRKALECSECDTVAVLSLIIDIQYRKRSYAEALQACDQLELHSPAPTVQLLLSRSKCLIKLRHSDEARERLTQALGLDGDNPQIHCWFGELYLGEGDLIRAKKSFNRALELDPENVHATFGLGMCWLSVKDFSKALKLFERVLELDSQHIEALFEKGKILKQEGRQSQAEQSFRRMLLLDTSVRERLSAAGIEMPIVWEDESHIKEQEEPEQLFAQSTEERRKGNYKEALKLINEALKMAPKEPMYLVNRSLIYTKLGNDAAARKDVIHASQLFTQRSSTKETSSHQRLRNATVEYAQLMTEVEETKGVDAMQKQRLANLRTSVNEVFTRNIGVLFEPSSHVSEGTLQQMMQQFNEMKRELDRIKEHSKKIEQDNKKIIEDNKQLRTEMSEYESRLDKLESHIQEVLVPIQEKIFPKILADRKLQELRVKNPKRYYYVIGLHQCLNCYLQSMRLVLSGLFKVVNPHTNVFAMSVIKGTMSLAKHIPVIGDIVEAAAEMILAAVQYCHQEKFKETLSKFNRLLKPYRTEEQISYEILEGVLWLSARPAKAAQIRDVVTYIELDRRKHIGKAIQDKAMNSFMSIKQKINGQILHIHERETKITKDQYSLTLVSTQDLLFFLEYVFRTDLEELPDLRTILRDKMCQPTEQQLYDLKKQTAKEVEKVGRTPEVKIPTSTGPQYDTVVLRNLKNSEYLTYNNSHLLRLVKQQRNVKRWIVACCDKSNPDLIKVHREDKSAFLSETPDSFVVLKGGKQSMEMNVSVWRLVKKTVKGKTGYAIQSLDSGLFVVGKIKQKKPFFSFCTREEATQSKICLGAWKEHEDYLWEVIKRAPSTIDEDSGPLKYHHPPKG